VRRSQCAPEVEQDGCILPIADFPFTVVSLFRRLMPRCNPEEESQRGLWNTPRHGPSRCQVAQPAVRPTVIITYLSLVYNVNCSPCEYFIHHNTQSTITTTPHPSEGLPVASLRRRLRACSPCIASATQGPCPSPSDMPETSDRSDSLPLKSQISNSLPPPLVHHVHLVHFVHQVRVCPCSSPSSDHSPFRCCEASFND
jgi:hypothetical protein